MIHKHIRRLLKFHRSFLSLFYYRSAFFSAWIAGGMLSIGRSCNLSVPLMCNGKGSVSLGDNVSIGYRLSPRAGNGGVLLQARSNSSVIIIGNRTVINNNSYLVSNCKITVGSDCRIGDNVAILDSDFHGTDPSNRKSRGPSFAVDIDDNAWIGSRSVLLKGVRIGKNSIIGSMSLVNKDIPPDCIAAGNPAKVIRRL